MVRDRCCELLIKFYHSDGGHFVYECASVLHNTHVDHKGND